jgi:hypothetical protein
MVLQKSDLMSRRAKDTYLHLNKKDIEKVTFRLCVSYTHDIFATSTLKLKK